MAPCVGRRVRRRRRGHRDRCTRARGDSSATIETEATCRADEAASAARRPARSRVIGLDDDRRLQRGGGRLHLSQARGRARCAAAWRFDALGRPPGAGRRVHVDGARIRRIEDGRQDLSSITRLRIASVSPASLVSSSGGHREWFGHDAHRGHRSAAGRSCRTRDDAAHRAGPRPGGCGRRRRRRAGARRAPAPGRRACSTPATLGARAGKLRALEHPPRVVLYAAGDDRRCRSRRASPARTGSCTRRPQRRSSSRRSALVARGGTALPPLDREQLDAAAHRVEPEDLALLAMLVDRTEPAEVAATLRLDRRKMARRIERLLARLRARRRARPGLTSNRGATCLSSPWSSSAPPEASANSTSSRGC